MPLDQLVKLLNIDIPRAHKVSVDSITDTAVYLHWDLTPEEQKTMLFYIYLNGVEVTTVSGFDSHCRIRELNPNTKYRIDLIATNPKGFKSKSRSMYIKTKSAELQQRASDVLLENPESLFKLLTDKSAKDPTVHKMAPTQATAETRAGRSRSNTVNSLNNAENGSVIPSAVSAIMIDPRSMEDIEELRFYLESGQEELHDILTQQAQSLGQFKEQEAALIEDRQTLRERKRLEDGNRQSIKSEITMLDDARRLADLKKAKQEAVLVQKKRNVEKMEQELSEWNLRLESFDNDREKMELSEDKVHHELDTDIKIKQDIIMDLQTSLSSLEETIKSLIQQKKQRESSKPQLIKVFKALRDHTNNSGMIDGDGVKALHLLRTLDPEVHDQLQNEIDMDTKLEAKWRAEQQREVSHCHKVSQIYETLKTENRTLKSGMLPDMGRSITPPQGSTPVSHPIQHSNSGFSNYSIPIATSNSNVSANANTNNGFIYGGVNGSSSPSLGLFNQSLSVWSNGVSHTNHNSKSNNNNYPINSLSLDTNVAMMLNSKNLESPDAQHYLPANLIGEELPDFVFTGSRPMEISESDGINSPSGSTSKVQEPSLLKSNTSVSSYSQNNMQFNNDFSANLSTRSIFHNEFGITPRYSLENTTSPPQSYHNDFVSPHNSPVNQGSTELSSLFSGGNTDSINAQMVQVPEEEIKPASTMFSPRRFSHVFRFGKKPEAPVEEVPVTPPVSAQKQRSKFFGGRSGQDVNPLTSTTTSNSNESPGGLFNMEFNQDKEKVTLDHLWNDNKSPFNGTIHSRNVSVNSNASLEKDNKSWSQFHNHSQHQQQQHQNGFHSDTLHVPSSHSVSSGAISDETDLGPTVHLSETNKSVSGTLKSSKSSLGEQSSSPSFFRMKKNLLTFGSGAQSPVKQQGGLFRAMSPSKIDVNEDTSIEDFNPSTSTTTPKRLFSMGRKNSTAHSRRQSGSSHELDHAVVDSNSIQSASTGNSRSIVRKLSFFSSNKNNGGDHKEIGNIEEAEMES